MNGVITPAGCYLVIVSSGKGVLRRPITTSHGRSPRFDRLALCLSVYKHRLATARHRHLLADEKIDLSRC